MLAGLKIWKGTFYTFFPSPPINKIKNPKFLPFNHPGRQLNSFSSQLSVDESLVLYFWQGMSTDVNICPCHLHGQNIFCPRQNQFCPRQKNIVPEKKLFVPDKIFCPRLKSLFLLHIIPWNLPCLIKKSTFVKKTVIFMGLCTVEINFLAMDKIFCHGQKVFVLDNIFLSGTKLIWPGTKYILSVQMAWASISDG